ncbi:MAG: hypothetical protein R3C17_22220 [Planctomycetaceae bacterium]
MKGPAGIEVLNRPLEYDYVYSGQETALNLIAGTYTLTLDADGDTTGAYAFRMLNLSGAPLLTPGTTVNDTLENTGAETDAYQSASDGGRQVFLRFPHAESTERLLAAAWTSGANSICRRYGSDISDQTLSQTGTYTLLIEGYFYDTQNVAYSFDVTFLGNTPPGVPLYGSRVYGGCDPQ